MALAPILAISLFLSVVTVLMLPYCMVGITSGRAGATANILDPVNEMWRKRANFRCQEMAEAGVSWDDLPLSLVSNTSVVGLIRKDPNSVRVLGAMEIDIEGQTIRVFDVLAKLSDRRRRFRDGFQSFMEVTLKEQIDLPHFFVYPGEPVNARTVTTYHEVDLKVLSMGGYVLESSEPPHRARSLFDSCYAYEILLPFIRQRDWSVEWNGEQLLVYRWDELLRPNDMFASTHELLELADMLKPASEAFSSQQAQEIAILAEEIGAAPEASAV